MEEMACRRIEPSVDVVRADETVPVWAEAFDDAEFITKIGIAFAAIPKLVPGLAARHDPTSLSHDLYLGSR
jgi:hypothetical protein